MKHLVALPCLKNLHSAQNVLYFHQLPMVKALPQGGTMFRRFIASAVCFAFIFSNFQYVHAQEFSINQLPMPGTMVGLSSPFAPLALKGIVVDLQKPLEFQFIVDTGKGPQNTTAIKEEANRLVKYFLAGLTIPEGDLWVNLSPYEKDRMVPEALGQTDLGRDLLAQDYILKQLTASLIYPEKDLGKEFWAKVYKKAQEQFGTTNIPVNTFNKVWILPDQAQVFENKNAAYVTKATLKVMLDEDYLALQKHNINVIPAPSGIHTDLSSRNGETRDDAHSMASDIVRQIILPEIEKEVNAGTNFAPLRQIYQALILAKWYKETVKNGMLEAVYLNQKKTAGVNLDDPTTKEQIYGRYLQAYKKGVFNYIKEDQSTDGQVIPRKYFSGGTLMKIPVLNRRGMASGINPYGAMLSLTVALNKNGSGGAQIGRREFLGQAAGVGIAAVNGYQQSAVQQAVVRSLRQFRGVTEPSDAMQNPARQQIMDRGKEAVPALMQFARDMAEDTDARKWAIRFLGSVAAPDDAQVRKFLADVISGAIRGFESWHAAEAQNALDELDARKAPSPQAGSATIDRDIEARLKQLSGISDPSQAMNHPSFNAVVAKGKAAVPTAIAFAKNTANNTDARKWAIRSLGQAADPNDAAVRKFLTDVKNNTISGFAEWHAIEAGNALDELNARKGGDEAMISSVTRRHFIQIAAAAAAVPCFMGCGSSEGNPSAQNPSVSNLGPDPEIIAWLRHNVFEDGMPRSFMLPKDAAGQRQLWQSIHGATPSAEVIERMIINDGLSLYDGAVWLTALAFAGGSDNLKAGDVFVKTLLEGRWGRLATIRGYTDPFKYQGKRLSEEDALFFRTLSPNWEQKDPLTGKAELPGGFEGAPAYNHNLIVWSDWKPILGENAWIMMAAMQLAYAKSQLSKIAISMNSDEIKLAQSLIPAFQALTTSIGAILHAPEGTFGKNPDDISNENNASAYAALRMLYQITKNNRYLDMIKGIENYKKKYGMDKVVGVYHRLNNPQANGILYQGGSYRNGRFTPNVDAFAVDVQTWSILAYSPQTLDEWYGEGAAFQMWKATKYRSGFYQDNKLFGVGYTDSHDIFSGEWTAGAIAATLELALHYANTHPDWAKEALQDAISMMQGLESLARRSAGEKGYVYVNRDVEIPFGWNGRPIGSTASTGWEAFLQMLRNPLILGGQTRWSELFEFARTVNEIRAGNRVSVALTAPAQAEQSNPADNLTVDEREANQWVNDSRFQNAGSGGTSYPYRQLKTMGTRAIPALIKTMINHQTNIESRKWTAQLLVEIATRQTAPHVLWAIQEFQRTASTPQEMWVRDYIQKDVGELFNKFGPITPVKPPYLDRAMANQAESKDNAQVGGIDLNQINVNREGRAVVVQFDPAQLNQLMQGGFEGFMPVIINITPIQSPLPLLGVNPRKEEPLEVAAAAS